MAEKLDKMRQGEGKETTLPLVSAITHGGHNIRENRNK